MRQIVQTGYGAPERVLKLADVAKPEPADDQVLVRVRATSVNSGDWRQVVADPFFVRLMLGVRKPRNGGSLGGDAAGVVEAVGKDVTDVAVGDEVFGIRSGSFADYVSGRNFVAKPINLTIEEAAAVPIASVTALQAVRDHAEAGPGKHLLINGAGGGVGHFCVQIAKALAAEVTAVTSTDKVDLARSIGADHVIDYRREDFTRGARTYDAIVDCGGDHSFGASRRVLKPGGRLVIVGSYRGVIRRLVFGSLRRRLLRQNIKFFLARVRKEDLVTIRDLVEAGKLRPVIDRTFTLEDAPAAIDYAARQQVRGKVVVTVPA